MSDQVASAPDGGPVDVAVAPEAPADAPVAADPEAEDAPKKDESKSKDDDESKDSESGVDPDPLPEGVEVHES